MKLELFEDDLKPESREKATFNLEFGDLLDPVQIVVRTVGRATFFRDKGTPDEKYNVIRSPEERWSEQSLSELPLDQKGLGRRALSLFKKWKLVTVGDLLKLDRDQLRRHGGKKTIAYIELVLAELGLSLKP